MRYLVLFVMAVSLCMFSVGCSTEKKTKKTGTEKPPVEKKTTE
jgi:hypothetical protein